MNVRMLDGGSLPHIGFGTYPIRGDDGAAVIARAIDTGYRLLDTATQYGNEATVGAALRAASVPRTELTLTSKLAGRDHGTERVRPALEATLDALGVETLDLWLIHWPNPSRGLATESFAAMLALRDEGLVGHVGVSNFAWHHLERLHAETGEWPVVNQIQLSPIMQRRELRAQMAEVGIVAEAWGPLGHREGLMDAPVLGTIADEVGATRSQIVLRWHLDHGIVPIPKSSDPARQAQNLELDGIVLTPAQTAAIDALDTGDVLVWDPDEHEEL